MVIITNNEKVVAHADYAQYIDNETSVFIEFDGAIFEYPLGAFKVHTVSSFPVDIDTVQYTYNIYDGFQRYVEPEESSLELADLKDQVIEEIRREVLNNAN